MKHRSLDQLYRSLVAAYTSEHLHTITAKIIDLYKNEQFAAIGQLMRMVDEEADLSNRGKMFNKLMMVYHPDRLNVYRAEIEKYYHEKNRERLEQYAHIVKTLELQHSLTVLKTPRQDPDMRETYEWEEQESGYGYESIDEDFIEEVRPETYGTGFYSALKRSIYGHENVELPFYYLEELTAIDLAGFGIDDLDGLRYCMRLSMLDLSHNEIVDISELSSAVMLEEVFLADNLIGYIDALNFAHHLRIADLSSNRIDDLSPLFTLQELEYVNVLGNPVPAAHIQHLRRRGIVVVA